MDAKGRILAVDYGEKNIGLAYCDALGLTVQPMPSMPNCGTANLLKKLRAIRHTLDIQEIVLGIPFKMDGTRGDAALHMEQLMEELKAALVRALTAKCPAEGEALAGTALNELVRLFVQRIGTRS